MKNDDQRPLVVLTGSSRVVYEACEWDHASIDGGEWPLRVVRTEGEVERVVGVFKDHDAYFLGD